MMRIPLTEPVSPRYIYINPETNKVHVLVPVVGGQEISTDNTCRALMALKEFFDGKALEELKTYQQALAFDIALLEIGNPRRAPKEERLAQIVAYIGAVSAMRQSYGDALTAFLAKPSNLYAIQLRPRDQDSLSKVVNPVFNIERRNDAEGTPRSLLFQALYRSLPGTTIARQDPRAQLLSAVKNVLPETLSFADIQQVLIQQFRALFGLSIDFTKRTDGTVATQAAINALMGFGADATSADYIDALLGACAPNVWDSMSTPPFYSIPTDTALEARTERLSILTQFFLANLNIYCKAQGISGNNFGVILDASDELSKALVHMVSRALSSGEDVERQLCAFCNQHATEFGLTRAITADDESKIKQRFTRTYRTVTATKENPHMDDFMILDTEATGETAKFVTHQGSIGVDFADIVDPVAAAANPDYFASIRADFSKHPIELPHKNEWVAGSIDIEVDVLVARMSDEQLEKLPKEVKEACHAHPTFRARQFVHDVAKGKQDEAEALLNTTSNKQSLLTTPVVFTDYSGRMFHCTAYEYAYWAKDTHMCELLRTHMDENTKAELLKRVDAIEEHGLKYRQNGNDECTKHFDFTPLKTALNNYVQGYDNWDNTNNWDAMKAAWMVVGLAQRDVPAHVIHEYCRPDRSFDPTPSFKESKLPRVVTFYNYLTVRDEALLPLVVSGSSGLGVDFALMRGSGHEAEAGGGGWGRRGGHGQARVGVIDLSAVTRLDEVRTAELTQSQEFLKPVEPRRTLGINGVV